MSSLWVWFVYVCVWRCDGVSMWIENQYSRIIFPFHVFSGMRQLLPPKLLPLHLIIINATVSHHSSTVSTVFIPMGSQTKIPEPLWKYLCYKNAISSFSRYSQNYRRSIRKVLKTFLKIHMYVHTCKYVSLSLIQHNQSTMFYYSHRCVNKSSMQRILQNSNLQIKNNPQAQTHSHSQWRIFHLFKHTNNNSHTFLTLTIVLVVCLELASCPWPIPCHSHEANAS